VTRSLPLGMAPLKLDRRSKTEQRGFTNCLLERSPCSDQELFVLRRLVSLARA